MNKLENILIDVVVLFFILLITALVLTSFSMLTSNVIKNIENKRCGLVHSITKECLDNRYTLVNTHK